jgi:hypothetical protein
MNDEQAREVFHATHESLFGVTEHLQVPHTTVARQFDSILAVTASWFICVCVCVDFVCVV